MLTGAAPGRSGPEAMTLFDSTGLAIQDLSICLALLGAHRAGRVSAGTVKLRPPRRRYKDTCPAFSSRSSP